MTALFQFLVFFYSSSLSSWGYFNGIRKLLKERELTPSQLDDFGVQFFGDVKCPNGKLFSMNHLLGLLREIGG